MLTFRSFGVQTKPSVEFKTIEANSILYLEVSFGYLLGRKDIYGKRNTQGSDQIRKSGENLNRYATMVFHYITSNLLNTISCVQDRDTHEILTGFFYLQFQSFQFYIHTFVGMVKYIVILFLDYIGNIENVTGVIVQKNFTMKY